MIDDASGDAHIENPHAPHSDPNVTIENYSRTTEQNHLLGMFTQEELADTGEAKQENKEQEDGNKMLKPVTEAEWSIEELHGEVLSFPTICHGCFAPCETNMKLTQIPHFKDVVIMATVCEACGLRTSEVKSGGGIEEKGVKIEVKVMSRDDFSRDVLKSETCHVAIRELDVEVGPSALGGRFTTVEGLLTAMRDQLAENSAMFGDSADRECQNRLDVFLEKFDEVLKGSRMVTVILDDPAGNSYVQALTDDGVADPNLRIIRYHRSHDQNEELGINDMKTEGYEEEVETR